MGGDMTSKHPFVKWCLKQKLSDYGRTGELRRREDPLSATNRHAMTVASAPKYGPRPKVSGPMTVDSTYPSQAPQRRTAHEDVSDFVFSRAGTEWILEKQRLTPQEALGLALAIKLHNGPRSAAKNTRVRAVIKHLEELILEGETQ